MTTLAEIGAVPLSEVAEGLRHAAKALPLHGKGGAVIAFAMVDPDDYALVCGYRWYLTAKGYAARNDGPRTVLLHRQLLGLEPGDGRATDHINRVPLDNRRENLRICTQAENVQNRTAWGRSKYRGVSFHKQSGKWMARCRDKYIGLFDSEQAAADAAALAREQQLPFATD